MNKLFTGDCLNLLKELHRLHPDGCIDLVYIDPPFCSNRNFTEFKDSWHNVEAFPDELKTLNEGLHNFIHAAPVNKASMNYLFTMAIRLHYIYLSLKNTGSFYLHCDPSMNHYLKIMCDYIFGQRHFKSEIIWKRTNNSGSSKHAANKFPTNTDVILHYTKSNNYIFNKEFRPYSQLTIKRYNLEDEHGKYMWAALSSVSEKRLIELRNSGQLKEDAKNKFPRYKKYFVNKGAAVDNIWDDVKPIPIKKEKEYSTQKPESLLMRIIKASSNPGQLVADFYAGSGTTIIAAKKLKRKYLGCDINPDAIELIKSKI